MRQDGGPCKPAWVSAMHDLKTIDEELNAVSFYGSSQPAPKLASAGAPVKRHQ